MRVFFGLLSLLFLGVFSLDCQQPLFIPIGLEQLNGTTDGVPLNQTAFNLGFSYSCQPHGDQYQNSPAVFYLYDGFGSLHPGLPIRVSLNASGPVFLDVFAVGAACSQRYCPNNIINTLTTYNPSMSSLDLRSGGEVFVFAVFVPVGGASVNFTIRVEELSLCESPFYPSTQASIYSYFSGYAFPLDAWALPSCSDPELDHVAGVGRYTTKENHKEITFDLYSYDYPTVVAFYQNNGCNQFTCTGLIFPLASSQSTVRLPQYTFPKGEELLVVFLIRRPVTPSPRTFYVSLNIWEVIPMTANLDCESAIALKPDVLYVSGDLPKFQANISKALPCINSVRGAYFFRYIVVGPTRISSCQMNVPNVGYTYGSSLVVLNGSCSALHCLASVKPKACPGSGQYVDLTSFTPGTELIIATTSPVFGRYSTLTVSTISPSIPVNSECSQALPILSGVPVQGDFRLFGISQTVVWYRFVTTLSSSTIVGSLCQSQSFSQPTVGIRKGCTLQPRQSELIGCWSGSSFEVKSFSAGSEYLVFVIPYSPDRFELVVEEHALVSTTCDNVPLLTLDTRVSRPIGTDTLESLKLPVCNVSASAGSESSTNAALFKFVPQSDRVIASACDTVSGQVIARIAVYDGDCNMLHCNTEVIACMVLLEGLVPNLPLLARRRVLPVA